MQEILVVIAIAAAVFFIPRLMKRGSSSEEETPRRTPQSGLSSVAVRRISRIPLTGKLRLAIVVTFLWLAGTTIYMKPWQGNVFWFFLIGPGPAIVLWGCVWAWFGYKKYRR